MRKGLFALIGIVGIFAFILAPATAGAQTVPGPKIESPNAATFDKFGDIPVDLATGTPNISIPIHTVHNGNINVPIALRYHIGALRVVAHASWVGLGWDLEAGGSITRTLRGAPDDLNGALVNGGAPNGYYPWAGSNVNTCGANLVNNSVNWYTPMKMDTFFSGINAGGQSLVDVSADEFSFSVMGHSGKFYYSGSTLGWQVASEENIQVQVISMLSEDQVVQTIVNEYNAPQALDHLYPSVGNMLGQTTQFSGFLLTMADGTKFYFGGTDAIGNGLGIEFFTLYGQNAVQFYANTWMLTKIVDVDGNEVDFNYSATYPIADMGIGFSANQFNCQENGNKFLDNQGVSTWVGANSINMNIYSGQLLLPVYLDNITSPNETVTFSRQKSSCLRLPDNVYRFNPSNTATIYGVIGGLLGDGKIDQNGNAIIGQNNLQWMQLHSIIVTNGNGPVGTIGPNGIGQIYREYIFNYSSSTSQRLTLLSFQEEDKTTASVQKYSFSYNNIANLPSYSGDMTDHYGFYNGLTLLAVNPSNADVAPNSIFQAKQTVDTPKVTYGALNQIIYPTGGFVTLYWQVHDYSQVVPNNRQSPLTGKTGWAGGCRIIEIKASLADGTLARDTRYRYVRGYSNASPAGQGSSGILNGTPTYFMNLTGRTGINGTINESIETISLNPQSVYGYNSEGSYLDYDQVVELNQDGSYTINYFTSYGPDYNGVPHFDNPPTGSVGWLSGDNYYPFSELDVERGKPVAALQYTANDVLVQTSVNTYRSDAARFNSAVRLMAFNNSYSGCTFSDALVLAAAYYKYIYDYYVVSKKITTYDQTGQNPISTTTAYQYNNNNLVSVKTETGSKGETIVTTYKYPPDLTDVTSVAMAAAHILSPVMQTTVTNNGALVSTNTANYYSPATGLFKPQTIQIQNSGNPVETRQSFFNYDSRGNINELAKTNDIHEVYLWGYFRQYPVAKITGATLSAVTAIVTQAQIDGATNTLSPTNDVSVRTLLQGLRTGLPNAMVTTYTYLPLSGITSETNPRGMTSFYQYDNFQRLQMITDNDGNVLKTFTYQYQIPQ